MKLWAIAADVRYALFTLAVCLACSLGLFGYLVAAYGLAWAWPFVNLPIGIALGIVFVVKLERVEPRVKEGWKYVNKAAFTIMFLSLVAEIVICFLAPSWVFLALPSMLYGVLRFDKVKPQQLGDRTAEVRSDFPRGA